MEKGEKQKTTICMPKETSIKTKNSSKKYNKAKTVD
jgi:hypothetical protein